MHALSPDVSADAGVPSRRPPALAHLGPAALFAALSMLLTWPLAVQVSTHIPGDGFGDAVVFFWNEWWMRHVLAGDGLPAFLSTDALFYPGGVDLALHTHTALNSLAAATLLGAAPLADALNLTILANGALNGFAAYLLAWRLTGHRLGSIAAGIFFAACPAVTGTLAGHFNFQTAWGLPLFACVFLTAIDRSSMRWAGLSGAVMAAVAYTDYYYFVYLAVFVACVLAHRWVGPSMHAASSRLPQSAFDRALLAIALVATGAALWAAITGGAAIQAGPVRLSLRSGTNVRAIATALFLWWAWRRYRPVPRWAPAPARIPRDVRVTAVAAIVCGLLIGPLLAHAFHLWRQGQYVSQAYFWRSAPAGLDVGSLVTGNPFNGWWGGAVRRLNAALGMNPYAGPLWFGIAPVVLAVTRRRWLRRAHAGLWLIVLFVFLVWSIGPYLLVFGVNTGLPMPQTLMRFVPVVSNARVPSHAAALVALATAVLLAMSIATFAAHKARWQSTALIAVLLADFWTAPIATTRLDRPEVYAHLATLPPGGVLEVPFGIRDGFGERGFMDVATLYYQTIHGHPMAGGYISRIPPGVAARYEQPPFDTLLALSSGMPAAAAPTGRAAAERLTALGISYVVINRRTAPDAVRDFVLSMPMTPLLDEGGRQLYRLSR